MTARWVRQRRRAASALQEPLLHCTVCGAHFYECHTHRAGHGRWKGYAVGPPGCGHPLVAATYVHPTTGAVLRPYAE